MTGGLQVEECTEMGTNGFPRDPWEFHGNRNRNTGLSVYGNVNTGMGINITVGMGMSFPS